MKVLDENEHKALVIWAADCAEHVLSVFEAACPEDKNPRQAIEAAKKWVFGQLKTSEVRRFAFAETRNKKTQTFDSAQGSNPEQKKPRPSASLRARTRNKKNPKQKKTNLQLRVFRRQILRLFHRVFQGVFDHFLHDDIFYIELVFFS